jgi:predicted phage terminase large subunit-like protein
VVRYEGNEEVMITASVIKGFSSSLLQKDFDGAVKSPYCHEEWWELVCSPHDKIAIAAPRRHAKTTAITQTTGLALMLFRERRYALIVSDTITQAQQFLGELKTQLAENERLRALFKIKEFIKETEDDFICMCEDGHTFRMSAKGAEQKLRGLKWNGARPDLILCDDLENDEIVMNKERRAKFKRWFYAALLPAMAKHGKIIYVGTILHNDSLLESLMPKRHQMGYTEEPLKTYLRGKDGKPKRLAGWVSVKYKAHTPDFSEILWKENYDAQFFKDLRQEYIEQGIPDVYSQEYLNTPIDESLAYFKRSDFTDLSNEDRAILEQPGWKKHFNFYIGTDLAVSSEQVSDWSVFVVGGIDEKGYLWILDVIRERMDSMEIVETILRLEEKWEPVTITMEKGQIEKSIGPFLRQRMLDTGVFPSITTVAPSVDKLTRARSIQARMRAGAVKFDKSAEWFYDFEDEALIFPRGKHDDQVDAMAYVGLIVDRMVNAASKKELMDEEYEEEYQQSGLADAGRSEYTGY